MFLVLQVKLPLVLYLHLVVWQVNSVENTRKFYKYHIFCYTFQLNNYFFFIALANTYGDMSSFKFLLLSYVSILLYFWYSALHISNLLSESHIFLKHIATPLGILSMLLYGKHVLGITYLNLQVALKDVFINAFGFFVRFKF